MSVSAALENGKLILSQHRHNQVYRLRLRLCADLGACGFMQSVDGSVGFADKLASHKQVKNRVADKCEIQRAERCNVSLFIK